MKLSVAPRHYPPANDRTRIREFLEQGTKPVYQLLKFVLQSRILSCHVSLGLLALSQHCPRIPNLCNSKTTVCSNTADLVRIVFRAYAIRSRAARRCILSGGGAPIILFGGGVTFSSARLYQRGVSSEKREFHRFMPTFPVSCNTMLQQVLFIYVVLLLFYNKNEV